MMQPDKTTYAASEEGSDLGDFIVEDSDNQDDAADFDEGSEEVEIAVSHNSVSIMAPSS